MLGMAMRWLGMLRRCYLQDLPGYEDYGARGIGVCEDWTSFDKYLAFWGQPPFEGASMGRIDNDGHYCPENCEWQSQEQQNNNTRRSKWIEWNGEVKTLADWARQYDVGIRRLSERLRRGWSVEKALTTPCPKGFEREREEHLQRAKECWDKKGRVYAARSRARKGCTLSWATQKLLEDEGCEDDACMQRIQAIREKKIHASDRTDLIIGLSQRGYSQRKIAKMVGVSKSSVQLVLKKENAKPSDNSGLSI